MIADSVILTADHCVDGGVQPGGVTVFILDLQSETAVGISVHPHWNGDPAMGTTSRSFGRLPWRHPVLLRFRWANPGT